MEHGFFHPDRGYWQTTNEPPEHILAGYPDGTISVPLKPGADYVWENGEWVDKTPDPEPENDPLVPLTARQLRLGLVMNGISLASVEATIAAIPDETDRQVATIEWEYASQFERDHSLIEQVGIALGLTSEQIDTMWKAALQL